MIKTNKKVITKNEVKPAKSIDINAYTKEKLAEDIAKHTKSIDRLVKIIANHENELKSQENDLLKLKDELIQLEKLKQFLP
jgi:hypothetical protein